MVSSTLKLGISILNGGNAEVQQVTRVGGQVSGCGWVFPSGSQVSPTPISYLLPLQKMLDYLKDKKEVGFFQSIQALMQTCRWGPCLPSSLLYWVAVSSCPGLFLFYLECPRPGKATCTEECKF